MRGGPKKAAALVVTPIPQVKEQIFDHTLQTIPEVQSDAENTFAGSKQRPTTAPSTGQDSQSRPSEDDDRDDMFEESTDLDSQLM